MINLATIGTSKIVGEFVNAALKTGRYCLYSVYSRAFETGKVFADNFFCPRIVTDINDLCNDKNINAVYIASPNALHFEQCRLLLLSGKHVICEKSITINPQQFAILNEIADKNGLIILEAIMSAHAVSRPALKKAISDIGDISLARLDFSRQSARYSEYKAGKAVNIFDMSLHAGTLMDMGIYCVYAAVDLFGMPKKIYASASFLQGNADTSGAAIFSYNTFDAVLTYGKAATSTIGSEIIGESGSVVISSVSQYLGIAQRCGDTEKTVYGFIPKTDLMMGEANDFADYTEEKNTSDYIAKTHLTKEVLVCMDSIKSGAGIKYFSE